MKRTPTKMPNQDLGQNNNGTGSNTSKPTFNIGQNSNKVNLDPKNQTIDSENDWQTVPILSQNKKRNKRFRANQSPSPSPEKLIPTHNSYSTLPIQNETPAPGTTKDSIRKPPPIMLYGIQDITKLNELIGKTLEKSLYSYKIVTKNQLRVTCSNIEAYKTLIKLVREKNIIGHTFTCKDERPYRIVIRNLHSSTPTEAIKEAIESTGNNIKGEIINARHGATKTPLSTWFVNLEPGPNNKNVKELKYIYHTSIVIEDPKRKKVIPQCKRCQQYGHTRNNCMRPYRCVKCAESHNTTECPKKNRDSPAKCALCLEDHPANYKGCKVFLEIQQRKLEMRPRITRMRPQNYECPPNQNEEQNKGTTHKNTTASYAQVVSGHTHSNISDNLENLLLKQAEKLDRLLDQMGTLMGLLTSVINKLVH